jgi:hypothetical protein
MELDIIEKTLRPNYYKKQNNLKSKHIGISSKVFFALICRLDVFSINIG